jgi:hypothetical protein
LNKKNIIELPLERKYVVFERFSGTKTQGETCVGQEHTQRDWTFQ